MERSTVEQSASWSSGDERETEQGPEEQIEVVAKGGRVEMLLTDNVFALDPKTIHARVAMRAYAYSIAASGDEATARALLASIGREG